MLCFLQTVGSEVEREKAGSVSARTVLSPKSSIWLVSPASLMGREWSLQNERGGMKGKSLLVAAGGWGRVRWGINSPFTATPHTTSSLIPKLSFFFFFYLKYSWFIGFPGSSAGKESACNAGDLGSIPGLRRSLIGKIPWRKAWYPTTVFLPRESPSTEEPGGLQSMGIKESDMTEWLSTARHTVDLQCFRCTVQWLRCKYTIIYMYILFKFFSIIDYRILNIISPYGFFGFFLCSVYLFILISQFIPPSSFPLW